VRDFEHTPAGDWWIILDLNKNAQVGEGQNATQEHSIILAASLTDMGMRTGRSVGFAAHGDVFVWHRPQLSDEHKWEILRSLALVDVGSVALSELLALVRPTVSRRSSLIIITPAVDGEWLPSLLALRRLGVVPTVMLLDPQSFGSDLDPSGLGNDLVELGITTQIIPRELLEVSEIKPGTVKDWGWRDSAGGSLVPSQAREEFSWRDLR
jgi:uncharacterized protein (DUF58 family)